MKELTVRINTSDNIHFKHIRNVLIENFNDILVEDVTAQPDNSRVCPTCGVNDMKPVMYCDYCENVEE